MISLQLNVVSPWTLEAGETIQFTWLITESNYCINIGCFLSKCGKRGSCELTMTFAIKLELRYVKFRQYKF